MLIKVQLTDRILGCSLPSFTRNALC